MPPAMVKKWAQEKGMSNKEAERRWKKAKLLAAREGRNPEITGINKDWEYVVGIYRTMMKKKPKEESITNRCLIEYMLYQVTRGHSANQLMESLTSRITENNYGIQRKDSTIHVGDSYCAGENLRTFFDGEGKLRFSTKENVLIRPSSDPRLLELVAFADCLEADNPVLDLFESYFGSLSALYKKVTDAFTLVY